MKPVVVVNRPACTGCGICVESCPTDVLRLDAEQKAFARYGDDCQGCILCVLDCPRDAIAVVIPPESPRL